MNPIKGYEDVTKWANEIFKGGGNKYIALTKSDQFEIAVVILQLVQMVKSHSPQTNAPTEEGALDQQSSSAEVVEGGETREEQKEPKDAGITSASCPEQNMTRAEYYHKNGSLPQEAYDGFVKYCESHPRERFVMDFQTGVKSSMAAFAYWLTGYTNEELTQPPKPKAKDIMNDWDN